MEFNPNSVIKMIFGKLDSAVITLDEFLSG
jgi:hypothetical protein